MKKKHHTSYWVMMFNKIKEDCNVDFRYNRHILRWLVFYLFIYNIMNISPKVYVLCIVTLRDSVQCLNIYFDPIMYIIDII